MIEAYSGTCGGCGKPFVAKSALGDIDPPAIKAGVETLKNAITDAQTSIINPLNSAEPLILDSMTIKQKDLSGNLESVKENIQTLTNALLTSIDSRDWYGEAVDLFNVYQQGYNDKAAADQAACEASHIEDSYYSSGTTTDNK